MSSKGKGKAKTKKEEDPELEHMLGRLRFIRQDLRHRFEEVAKQLGISVSELEAYVNNSTNFPPVVWQDAEEKANDMKKRLANAIQDPKKLRKTIEEVKRDDANRRHKTLGVRKKWIPIR